MGEVGLSGFTLQGLAPAARGPDLMPGLAPSSQHQALSVWKPSSPAHRLLFSQEWSLSAGATSRPLPKLYPAYEVHPPGPWGAKCSKPPWVCLRWAVVCSSAMLFLTLPAKKSLSPCPRVLSTACLSHGPHSADTQCPEDKEHTHAPEGASLGFTVQIPG